MRMIATFVISVLILNLAQLAQCYDHWSERKRLVKKEQSIALGSSIKLNDQEKCVNQGLMALKHNELDQAIENSGSFYPSMNFLKAVKYIDASDVFDIIRRMPKGAALHLHDTALASPKYLFKLTFAENLYVCWTKGNRLLLNFFLFHVDNRCEWVPLETAREEEGFDDLLKNELSMATAIYKSASSSQVAWNELLGTFATIEGLISYKPIFTAYLTEVLSKLYEDNVMYVELRTMLLPVYDLEGNVYHPSDVATLLKDVLEDFQCSHADFLGGKIIYTPSRMVEYVWMDRYMEIMEELSSEHPDFVAGFDLVGQEDLSYPLSKFVGSLQGLKNRVSYFFSAGETNWIGTNADINVYDAILLKPSRIGHAFTLFNHPEILRMVKEQNIAIEVCPISNQMMMLVDDLRNHPGKFLIAQGYPIVISSDNPGFWGARILSHDWYEVFMAMADRNADLRLLKQLAINSLTYSAITDKEKALSVLEKKWKKFISDIEFLCKPGMNITVDLDMPEITTEAVVLETPIGLPDYHEEVTEDATVSEEETAEDEYESTEDTEDTPTEAHIAETSSDVEETDDGTEAGEVDEPDHPETVSPDYTEGATEDEPIDTEEAHDEITERTETPAAVQSDTTHREIMTTTEVTTEVTEETTESESTEETTETASTGETTETGSTGETDETGSTAESGATGVTGATDNSNESGGTGASGAPVQDATNTVAGNGTESANKPEGTAPPGGTSIEAATTVNNATGGATQAAATVPMPAETTTTPAPGTLSPGQLAKSKAVQAAKERSRMAAARAARSTVAMRAVAS